MFLEEIRVDIPNIHKYFFNKSCQQGQHSSAVYMNRGTNEIDEVNKYILKSEKVAKQYEREADYALF